MIPVGIALLTSASPRIPSGDKNDNPPLLDGPEWRPAGQVSENVDHKGQLALFYANVPHA
jgi:hypothetical protein